MLNTFKACIVRLCTLAIISYYSQWSALCDRCITSIHEIMRIFRVSIWCIPLSKHCQCIAVSYLYIQFHRTFEEHFLGIDLFWWWFIGCIGYKFPYLVVGPKFLLLFLLGQCCPLDRYVNLLMHIESIIEGFVINVEDTFVQCYFLK